MTYSSSLADKTIPLVLDTSVLINLHASGHGCRILGAIPNDIFVPRIVAAELDSQSDGPRGEHHFTKKMADIGKFQLIAMNQREYALFGNFVSGTPSLGDGEAATIAISSCRRYFPIIDERKGRLRAQEHLCGNHPGWSLDLFRHPRVVAVLGTNDALDALYCALREGRMRIHEQHCEQVVSLIGVPRALECSSLPRYKMRRHHWQMSADTRIISRSI